MGTSKSTFAHRRDRPIVAEPVILIALAALVLASSAWAFSLRGDRDDAQTRVTELESEIDLLRVQSNATAYRLDPSESAPSNAQGTAFFSLSGPGMIGVSNLEQAPKGRSYQVWYYPTAEAAPLPGATFAVDDDGTGFMLIPADVGVFTLISITLEPEVGTTSPTGPVMLSGTTGGARG